VLKQRKIKTILTLSVIIWVACWISWMFFGREFFEVGQAFAIFGFSSAFVVAFPLWKISKISFAIALNQLMDELFFDPFKVDINEYICMIAIVLLIIYNDKINEISRIP